MLEDHQTEFVKTLSRIHGNELIRKVENFGHFGHFGRFGHFGHFGHFLILKKKHESTLQTFLSLNNFLSGKKLYQVMI